MSQCVQCVQWFLYVVHGGHLLSSRLRLFQSVRCVIAGGAAGRRNRAIRTTGKSKHGQNSRSEGLAGESPDSPQLCSNYADYLQFGPDKLLLLRHHLTTYCKPIRLRCGENNP